MNFQNWREQRQARRPDHTQLNTTAVDDDEHELHEGANSNTANNNTHESSDEMHPLGIPSGHDDGAEPTLPRFTDSTPMIESSEDEETGSGTSAPTNGSVSAITTAPNTTITTTTTTTADSPSRRTFTLADLEDERELARRRTSFCVLFAVFILFRLWLQAVATGDFFLLMICLFGTSWTARFIRHTREREEEIDRLIAGYHGNRRGNINGTGGSAGDGDGTDPGMEVDLQRMSFQAQLAMAIIQSQRELMQGGFGNPDGSNGGGRGVSETAKQRWNRFAFRADGKGNYGSLSIDDGDNENSNSGDTLKAPTGPPLKGKEEDEPHCSICLGEYEEGEELVCLPCQHIYHEDCVGSWCTNHIRCPLCNFDLESGSSDDTVTTTSVTTSSAV